MGSSNLRQFITLNSHDPIFFIGTRAELIKVAPVIARLRQADIQIKVLWAGLHSQAALDVSTTENVRRYLLAKSDKDQDSIAGVFTWFLGNFLKVFFYGLLSRVSRYRPEIIIVHGDTLCTVLGSLFAKVSGAKLMHIEAGVRSGKFLRPFPEEISRRFVSRLTDLHFAPGKRELINLSQHRGEKINTIHNTSRDALSQLIQNVQFGDDGYLVVTLHRNELLSSKKRFAEIVEKIIELSKSYPIRWFVGNHERSALLAIALLEKVTSSNIQLEERSSHEDFTKILTRAHCVITDSGGLQSECNDLGIPVIVHRNESEYSNPENSPCVLTKWDLIAIDSFLANLKVGAGPRGIHSQVVAADIITKRITAEIKGV